MPESNLLVISNSFPNQDNTFIGDNFVKEQLKYIKNYFDNIYVISPIAYGMEYLRKTRHNDYQFDNVSVFFPEYINNPIFWYHGKSMWLDLETRAVKSLINRKHLIFDLIHAHFTWPSGAVAIRLKKEFKVPVVITEHAHLSLYNALRKKDQHYIDTWIDCDAIIRVSKKDIPLISSFGVDPSKVHLIPNGYDPAKISPTEKQNTRESLGLPHNINIILNISRLNNDKGHKYLIYSIYEIIKARDDIICIIGGKGPLRGALEKQIKSLNINKHVQLAGFISSEKLGLWISACDLFVLPSLSESFGIVQLEALGCGKPVVATRNGGSEDIITSIDVGLLADPANPEDLSEKILIALDREWDSEKILAYAERYTWANVAKEIVDVYEEVLK